MLSSSASPRPTIMSLILITSSSVKFAVSTITLNKFVPIVIKQSLNPAALIKLSQLSSISIVSKSLSRFAVAFKRVSSELDSSPIKAFKYSSSCSRASVLSSL